MERRVVELHLSGSTGREICKALKTGDRKVRRILADAEAYGYLSGTPLPPVPLAIFAEPLPDASTSASAVDAILLAHKDWVTERLTLGWKPVSVWEELPVEVARSSFYRFLNRHRLDRISEKRARLIPEIVHKPGEALLVDWGKLRSVKEANGKTRTLWAFVGVLGFSRYMMVRLVWTNDVATTILALESMLKELGGVPLRITSDNPKCFAIEASKYEPLLNPVLERWSAHYGTLLECLPPADPQKKGKVERLMPFVRGTRADAAGGGDSATAERVMEDGAFYIKRGEKIGPFTAKLITVILEQGQGFVDTRKVWGILSLDKTNTHEAIEAASKLALEMNEPSYRRVVSLINLFKKETAPSTQAAAESVPHKFVRDLNEYKQLLREQKEIKDEPSNAN